MPGRIFTRDALFVFSLSICAPAPKVEGHSMPVAPREKLMRKATLQL